MSAIAKLAGFSMGSVYKFVQCKEDVLIALATKMYQERQRVFKQGFITATNNAGAYYCHQSFRLFQSTNVYL